MRLPAFTQSGVLPPYVGSDPAQAGGRSPYTVSLTQLVNRLGTSRDRRQILRGYLDHREGLIGAGFVGFQWLDGSFAEDIETTQGRPPNDIDVVTFFARPANLLHPNDWSAFVQANSSLLVPSNAKTKFKTDPYFVDIGFAPAFVIEQTAYWLSLFSHQRTTGIWKGMIQVGLDTQQDDVNARQLLGNI